MDDLDDIKDSIKQVETQMEKQQILGQYQEKTLKISHNKQQDQPTFITSPPPPNFIRRNSEGGNEAYYNSYRHMIRPVPDFRPPVRIHRPDMYAYQRYPHELPARAPLAPSVISEVPVPHSHSGLPVPKNDTRSPSPQMPSPHSTGKIPNGPLVYNRGSSPGNGGGYHDPNMRPILYHQVPLHPTPMPSFRPMLHNPDRRSSDTSSEISMSARNANTSAVVREALIPHGNLEEYRQDVKKSNDPIKQFGFAKQLILVAEEMRKNPQGLDVAKVRKNRDILHAEAVRWIKKAAQVTYNGKTGYPDASFFLADCYGNGTLGLSVDHNRAFGYYVQGTKHDHPASIYRTGVCYEVGAGPKRDHIRAVQYYKKAAMLGDTAAMYKVGMILLNGTLGQQKNPREGVNFLKRAANQADETTPFALHELAILFEGVHSDPATGVVPDPAYAFELYLKSAKLGYPTSQYKLGLSYEYGHLGLMIDPVRSIAWYTKAAEQGEPEAELALSGWYLTGFDTILPRNEFEAYLWARKAADKGLAKAEYAIAYFLEHGIGVQPDLEEARRWYLRAAGQGNSRAIARLKGNQVQSNTRPSQWRNEVEAQNGNCSIM